MRIRSDKYGTVIGLRLAFATLLAFGIVETSSASSCDVTNVTLDGNDASACGFGTTNNTTTPGSDIDFWRVNLDSAGGMDNWSYFEKEEEGSEGNAHDGNTTLINLLVSPVIGDDNPSGTFTLNAADPTLITLVDGTGGGGFYHWYVFEGIVGQDLSGTWNMDDFEGKDLSNMSAYTKTNLPPDFVPVPAAVWLFGSGLLGLVGVARRRKSS
jgi:hypothetical protein